MKYFSRWQEMIFYYPQQLKQYYLTNFLKSWNPGIRMPLIFWFRINGENGWDPGIESFSYYLLQLLATTTTTIVAL